MYIIYYSNDGLFCLNCLNDFFCTFLLEIKDLKKKKKLFRTNSTNNKSPPTCHRVCHRLNVDESEIQVVLKI